MEIKGKVTAIPPEKTGVSTRGPWRKVFIVVEYDGGQYPKQVILSNMNKAEDFSRLKIGDVCTFKFDGSVNERNGNYYMDLNCWSWKLESGQPQTAPPVQSGSQPF